MATSSRGLDPATLATIWHHMQTTCREMRHLLERTCQNYLMGQLRDVSVGLWAADGSMVAAPLGMPNQFLGTGLAIHSQRVAAILWHGLGLQFGTQPALEDGLFRIEIGVLAALQPVLQQQSVRQHGMNQFGDLFTHQDFEFGI